MAKHPYEKLPNSAYWRRSFQGVPVSEVDPVLRGELKLDADTKVAMAGNCFAQHLARHLRENGLNFYVTERPHPVYGRSLAQPAHFGDFPARFGNIYTARQLLQLFKRVYAFEPKEDIWRESNGTFLDPFRPQINREDFPPNASTGEIGAGTSSASEKCSKDWMFLFLRWGLRKPGGEAMGPSFPCALEWQEAR